MSEKEKEGERERERERERGREGEEPNTHVSVHPGHVCDTCNERGRPRERARK